MRIERTFDCAFGIPTKDVFQALLNDIQFIDQGDDVPIISLAASC